MTVDLNTLLKSVTQVASFPAIVQRLHVAVEDPNNSLAKIGEIASEDPGISARMLKLANSGFYSFPGPVTTITRALILIGAKQFRDLVISTAVMEMFKDNADSGLRMEAFWQHSIACGVAARVIATARREPNGERFYLTGLLHDIGRLVIHQFMPEQSRQLFQHHRESKQPMEQLERERLGFDHGLLGSELLRNWELPNDLVLPIRWCHQPDNAIDYQVETAILHVADFMVNALYSEYGEKSAAPMLNPAAWERIDLPTSAVPNIVRHLEIQSREAMEIFLH